MSLENHQSPQLERINKNFTDLKLEKSLSDRQEFNKNDTDFLNELTFTNNYSQSPQPNLTELMDSPLPDNGKQTEEVLK